MKRNWSVFPGRWTSHLTATKRISDSWSGSYAKRNRSDQTSSEIISKGVVTAPIARSLSNWRRKRAGP